MTQLEKDMKTLKKIDEQLFELNNRRRVIIEYATKREDLTKGQLNARYQYYLQTQS